MDLSASAGRVLNQLCSVKGSFLFGHRGTDDPFKLMAGSTSVSVPRLAVNELLNAGFITRDSMGEGEGWTYTSFIASADGRSHFRHAPPL